MRKILLIGLVLVMSLATTSVFAQSSATATVDAVVLSGLSLSNTATVNFGSIAPSSTPVIDPKGASHSQVGAAAAVGTFTLTGTASSQVTVNYDATATLGDGGTNTITFTPDLEGHATTQGSASNITSGSQVSLDASGNFLFWLGGNLGTLSSQAAGTYATDASNGSGDWSMTVSYN